MNETKVGIAVHYSMSSEASIAMDGFLHGRSRNLEMRESGAVIYWYDDFRNFSEQELDDLVLFLAKYMDDDDPMPYLCQLSRSKEYEYTGKAEPDGSR